MVSLASSISFAGKRALVTGAGRGIGRVIVQSLVASGIEKVYAVDKLADDLDSLVAEYPEHIEPYCLDLADWNTVEEVLTRKVTRVDHVVNNAGIVDMQAVGSVTKDSLDAHFAVNVSAAVNVSQVCAEKMISTRSGGSIVNVTSTASTIGLHDHLSYCASKAALDAATRVLALELGPHNVRVNSVRPTITMTAMAAKAWADPARAAKMKARIPLGRFAQPQEIVNAILFLLSDSSSMISGASLDVDGGFTAC